MILVLCAVLVLFWAALSQKQNYFQEKCVETFDSSQECPCTPTKKPIFTLSDGTRLQNTNISLK